jgi:hypothetical protein
VKRYDIKSNNAQVIHFFAAEIGSQKALRHLDEEAYKLLNSVKKGLLYETRILLFAMAFRRKSECFD